MSSLDNNYQKWVMEPTADNMGNVLKELYPTLNSEVQRYNAPTQLLRQHAKALAVKSVKSYDPTSNANLRSWVVTGLQPLYRYSREMTNAVHVPEQAHQQSAIVNRRYNELTAENGIEPSDEELSDDIGISLKRVKGLKSMSKAVVYDEGIQLDVDTNVSDLAVDDGRDSRVDAAVDAVYGSLDARDKMIYDLKTGGKGKPALNNQDVAKRLGVTPGLVSQRSLNISNMILETKGRV